MKTLAHPQKSARTLRLCSFVLFCTYLLLAPLSSAESLAAHTHGVAHMTIAMADESIAVEIISPAANLVGFEHQAQSEREVSAVKKATKILHQPEKLLTFSGGECSLLDTELDISALKPNASDEHEHEH
ncbi:DUF2796 domain-containing protein, partial [Gilvimarinus agarilyticus]